jgi:hypothetical protein
MRVVEIATNDYLPLARLLTMNEQHQLDTEKFIQQCKEMKMRTILVFSELDREIKQIYTYKISGVDHVPTKGDFLQIPKISHDKSNNNTTQCEVVKRMYLADQKGKDGSALVPVLLVVSLCFIDNQSAC